MRTIIALIIAFAAAFISGGRSQKRKDAKDIAEHKADKEKRQSEARTGISKYVASLNNKTREEKVESLIENSDGDYTEKDEENKQ